MADVPVQLRPVAKIWENSESANAADCKSVVTDIVGSAPTSPTKVKWLDMVASVQIRQHVLRRCDSLGWENSIVDSLYLPKQY